MITLKQNGSSKKSQIQSKSILAVGKMCLLIFDAVVVTAVIVFVVVAVVVIVVIVVVDF